MRRILSIAICSLVVCSASFGQITTDANGNPVVSGNYVVTTRGADAASVVAVPAGSIANGLTVTGQWTQSGVNFRWVLVRETEGVYLFGQYNSGSSWTYLSSLGVGLIWSSGSEESYFSELAVQVVQESESFAWEFGAEWSGVLVEVIAPDGTVLFSDFVPEGGGTVSGQVVADSLEGVEVYLDGVSVTELATGAASAGGDSLGAERGFYELGFDGSYDGTAWEIRRADGSVAASGTAGANIVLSGGITVLGGEDGEVWIEQDLGDGLGTAFVPTGVTIDGSGTTEFSFVNNPQAPSPTPFPTPEPVPATTEVVIQPSTNNIQVPTVTTSTNSSELVPIQVSAAELGSVDDGEEGLLEEVASLQGLLAETVVNLTSAQANFVAAGQTLNALRLQGVGRQCTFSIGPAEVHLQTSGAVRAGLKLLIIGTGAFAAAGMIRNAVQ